MRRFGPSAGSSVLAWGGSGIVNAGGGSGGIRYGDAIAYLAAPATVLTPQGYILAPYAGILRNLFCMTSAVFGAGAGVDFTVRVNDANTAIVVNIQGAVNTTGQDVTNSVSVVQGDRITIGLTRNPGVPASTITIQQLEFVKS